MRVFRYGRVQATRKPVDVEDQMSGSAIRSERDDRVDLCLLRNPAGPGFFGARALIPGGSRAVRAAPGIELAAA